MRARCGRALRCNSFLMTGTVIADCACFVAVSIMTVLFNGLELSETRCDRWPRRRKASPIAQMNFILVKCTLSRNRFIRRGAAITHFLTIHAETFAYHPP